MRRKKQRQKPRRVYLKELKELFPTQMAKYNNYKGPKGKKLTKIVSVPITPKQERGIELIINSGKFSSKAEFVRYLIIKYFDEMTWRD